MKPFVIGLVLIAIVIMITAMILVLTTRRGKSCANREKYQKKWLQIQNSIKKSEPATVHMAIINADKLLDQALKERCFNGATCLERIKSAKGEWQNVQALASAHRLRNQLVHEDDVKLNFDEAKRALASFKQGLKDLGAI